jgi:PAS domain S-box-containing protein
MSTTPIPSVESLSESERLQVFISGINDYAIYMLSPEGTVRSWNAGAQRFKGYAAAEIIGQHFSRFYTAEDRESGLPDRALQAARQEGKFEAEGWRLRKDGSRFWASVVIDRICDANGNLIGFAKVTRDIDDRRKAQAAMHASEEKFRLLVQGVTDYAIYMLSPSGEITNWNSGAERIKGFTGEEVVGTHFSRFYTQEDLAKGLPARALAVALKEGHFEAEGFRLRKDGTRFWAHVVIDPIRSPSGELLGFAKITRDITERKEAAAALERAKESLFQAQKLDAIGRLTGGVAHDFNNLLSVIVSGLEILSSQISSPAGRKTLESMLRAAAHGSTLTRQLLSFARQQPLRQDKYDLNSLITSFEPLLGRAKRDSVSLEMDLAPDLKPIRIDAVQFEASLLNLVTNANDAMPAGGTLLIRTRNIQLAAHQVGQLAPGEYVEVTVADTGCGMSPEVAARAIEPFFTTKEIGKGTGMGLSQVYGLVQQSGGDMLVTSTPGKGTTITLYLPALPSADATELASTSPSTSSEELLVVDGEPEVVASAMDLFSLMGYHVLGANSAAEALEILRSDPAIQVLFTDVAVPGMDGVALGREARRLVPGLKVVLTSGVPAAEREAADDAEFPVVGKPFRMAEVAKMLRHSADDHVR